MNTGYVAYRWLTTAASTIVVPLIWLHHRFKGDDFERFHQRMGRYAQHLVPVHRRHPCIWLHAVSVGEVGVAAAICNVLSRKFSQCTLVLSCLREQGLARAKELLDDSVFCFFAPLDLIGPTQKALKMFRPDVLVLLETEIWPNLIIGARRMGVRTVIANGRISVRSIKRYLKVRSLMKYTLSHVDAFSMISEDDAWRIQSLGASPERISVNGNAKYDVPDPLKNKQSRKCVQALYGVDADTPVFVAGSTRGNEAQIILDAFVQLRQQHPDAFLIIAPRHIERAGQIAQWVVAQGLTCQLRTQLDGIKNPRRAQVVVLDTIGELSATYGIASMVFCGGSLVPKGGQNIMEPAIWGKPVIYGPSMEDFADAKALIESNGGGLLVQNAAEIAAVANQWLGYPHQARAIGRAARQAILPHGGAAEKHAEVIRRLV